MNLLTQYRHDEHHCDEQQQYYYGTYYEYQHHDFIPAHLSIISHKYHSQISHHSPIFMVFIVYRILLHNNSIP
jgi:hypothetical protein